MEYCVQREISLTEIEVETSASDSIYSLYMPFTPFHMGPGIFIKALLQGSFSLMVFGWTQVIMDIQPLVVLISGEGHYAISRWIAGRQGAR